jgi:EAL domain-containing protein (putative c-di-GMP-specific phosphodiesterase class I)
MKVGGLRLLPALLHTKKGNEITLGNLWFDGDVGRDIDSMDIGTNTPVSPLSRRHARRAEIAELSPGATTMSATNREHGTQSGCNSCQVQSEALFPFTMAFQPIVHRDGVFAYEALVRGPQGESAASVLGRLNESNQYAFDQACRVKAIELSAQLSDAAGQGRQQRVSINFLPNAVYNPANCIRKTLETAQRVGMDLSNIVFEVTEGERIADRRHLLAIFHEYKKHGLRTAIDDFGAGYAGLDLLAEFQPDIVKLDMAIVRDIDGRPASRAIVRAVVALCRELDIVLIAEGIETRAELIVLEDLGVALFQGYLFAKPQLEAFPDVSWPRLEAADKSAPHEARPAVRQLPPLTNLKQPQPAMAAKPGPPQSPAASQYY